MGYAALIAAAAGTIIDGISKMNAAKTEEDVTKLNAANDQEAMRKEHRANFGSMLSQASGSGVDLSSFSDLFSNQTIEDGRQMSQLKQQENNFLAKIKNKKNAAKVGILTGLGSAGAEGAETYSSNNGGFTKKQQAKSANSTKTSGSTKSLGSSE
jgi:hypothetical protein